MQSAKRGSELSAAAAQIKIDEKKMQELSRAASAA